MKNIVRNCNIYLKEKILLMPPLQKQWQVPPIRKKLVLSYWLLMFCKKTQLYNTLLNDSMRFGFPFIIKFCSVLWRPRVISSSLRIFAKKTQCSFFTITYRAFNLHTMSHIWYRIFDKTHINSGFIWFTFLHW